MLHTKFRHLSDQNVFGRVLAAHHVPMTFTQTASSITQLQIRWQQPTLYFHKRSHR